MHVICKKCATKITVAGRPTGTTSLKKVIVQGSVRVGDGRIAFGPGGSISIGAGGSLGFGAPQNSPFTCPYCGSSDEYAPDEIRD
jgi:hypothetical protein